MRRARLLSGACMAAFLLAACGTSPKEHYYTLNPVPAPAPASAGGMKTDYNVSVGPISIPDMLDRPQFVVRQGPNRVEVVEQHRWAESLQTGIARVLAADLGSRLGNAQVTSYNDYAGRQASYRVLIDIERFDAVPGDSVTVQAVWTIRPAQGAARTGRSAVREAVRGSGYDDIAAAYGQALSVVSAEIASALQALQVAGR